jgi:predicted amidophosphoribosyltransferase
MLQQGLAGAIEPILQRVRAVPKAHFSRQGERPDVAKHRGSMEVDARILAGTRITLVDDVITQGRTLYAGSTLVQEALPTKTVRAFGVIRTMGLIPDVERILDPCVGTLTPNTWGGVDRWP